MVIKALERQPTSLDYASPTQFRFIINQLPKVEYFTVAVAVPSIILGEAIFPTPFRQIPIAGDELTYDNFNLSFIVDEKLENYITLHNWLIGHGFPRSREQFSDFRDTTAVDSETAVGLTTPVTPTGNIAASDRVMTSDATLSILSNHNNPIVEIRFTDMYPTSIGALQYDQGATDVEYLKVDATFSYQLYTIHTL
jgi:hypothetical protein